MKVIFKNIRNLKSELIQLLLKTYQLQLRPVPVFLLCACLIVASALVNDSLNHEREKADMHRTLSNIGQLKAGQIHSYLKEREGDALVMLDLLNEMSIQDWLNNTRHVVPPVLKQTISSIASAYHYSAILVLDSNADVRVHSNQNEKLTAREKSMALQAMREGTSAVNLYANNNSAPSKAVLDTFVPILNHNKSRIIGMVVMRSYSDHLFNLIQSWPIHSKTGEILLVTKDGDDVLFLNELRHQKNTALNLRIPINRTSASSPSPEISAVMGRYGPQDSNDYRAKSVLAYTLPVPDTTWSMVVKIDTDEALQHSARLRWTLFCFVALLILLLGLLIRQCWVRAQSYYRLNKRLRESEANLRRAQSVARVGSWTLAIKDNAFSCTEECYRILGVNPGTHLTYEAFLDRVHADDREFVNSQWKASPLTQSYDIEYRLIAHDGQVTWVRERAELQYDPNGELISRVGTTQDITERRMLEDMLRQSREHFIKVFDQSPVGMVIRDLNGKCLQSNQVFQRIFGYSQTELQDKSLSHLVHSDDRDKIDESYRSSLESGEDSCFYKDRRYVRKNGEVIWGRVITALVRDSNNKPSFTITMFEDITARKQVEEEMKLASLVYQSSNEAIQVTDSKNRIIAINPAYTEITGYSSEEVVGKNAGILKSGKHSKDFYSAMWDKLNKDGKWQGEIWNRRKNGEFFAEWLSINTIYNDDATVHRRVALFSDITEKKKNEDLIWNQANYDALTNLPNRNLFRYCLEDQIKKSKRTHMPLALCFIDLDRFKEVNDTLGHDMGDILLKEAATRIKSCVRESDSVGRFGGDEFTIILSELQTIDCIGNIVNNILAKLATPFQLENNTIYISACIGIAIYPDDAKDVTGLLKCADQAMYAAKCEGENRFHYYTPEMQKNANMRMRLINDMHTALSEQQFKVYYQPIIDFVSGEIHKAEALIRWQHPEFGLVSPAEFIPIAEETGLINKIGDWVFYQAARQTAQLRTNYNPDFQISINKSPVQFLVDSDKHDHWLNYLNEIGLPKQALVIEITEGLLMEAKERIRSQLLTFRDNGIQVALDDFGTGYSSLSYIKKFDIDYIKIDRSFISNLAIDNDDMVLCEAIINMAHKLGIKTIAEGVETESQLILLKQMGCDFGQGYFFSKPLPSDEFEKMLYERPKAFNCQEADLC